MGLMRVNRPIIPYFYEVNKINKQEWEWTGASKEPEESQSVLDLILTSEIKTEDVRPGVVSKVANSKNGKNGSHKILKWTLIGLGGVVIFGTIVVTKIVESSLGSDPFINKPSLTVTEEYDTRFCVDSILMRPDAPYALEKILESLPSDEDFVKMTSGLSKSLKDDYHVIKGDRARMQWLVDNAWDICALNVILNRHRARYMRSVGLPVVNETTSKIRRD